MDFFEGEGHEEHVHKTPSFNTKTLQNVIYCMINRTAFVKFTIIITFNKTKMKHIFKKSIGKSIPAYGFHNFKEKNLRTKSLETFAKCL
jgi:hypothetical protein